VVARDRIQPGPERHVAVAPSQCAKRGDERQLKRIFGRVTASQHVRAEREHAASVSVVDRLERTIVACTQAGHQIVVIFAFHGAAIGPTAEPGYCRVRPHAHSVRYQAPKVQSRRGSVKDAGGWAPADPMLGDVPCSAGRGSASRRPGIPYPGTPCPQPNATNGQEVSATLAPQMPLRLRPSLV
jgi:hypothetical protein